MRFILALSPILVSTFLWAAPACNNENLLNLLKRGVGEQAIINAINSRNDCTFDVNALKASNVSPLIITAIETKLAAKELGGDTTAGSQVPPSIPNSQYADGQAATMSGMSVVLVANNATPQVLPLEQAMPNADVGFMGYKRMRLMGPDRTTKTILQGRDSKVQVKPSTSLYLLAKVAMQDPSFKIVTLKANKNDRTLSVYAIGMTRQKFEEDEIETLPVESTPQGFKLQPKQPLPPGKYGIVHTMIPNTAWTFDISESPR